MSVWLESMAEYMLDTSTIGEFADGQVDARDLYTSSDKFFITHIQEDELSAAGSYSRILNNVLEVVDASSVTAEEFRWGFSAWDRSKWGKGEFTEDMLNQMDSDDGNELKDVVIAETAIQNNYTLVTHDDELQCAVNKKTPGKAISISDFASRI
ncbi:hypothetical protein [Halobellus ruber]|uniref:PIN domain-containing protein n=1 Tax=Halobellus ruber TaxID=2761102 RepID=A0A7J9SGC8_9EURY|nr:hypothetical protein [Halobellus ruber]MBB6645046.1 hypothetical protein [Halobellus ruber]